MNSFKSIFALGTAAMAGMTTAASAQSIGTEITSDLGIPANNTASADALTWTKEESPIILTKPIFVRNGASLTIEAGVTVVTFTEDDGGLVIAPNSQLFALGTSEQPIIMTSAEDVATWDNAQVTRGSEDLNNDGTNDVVSIQAMGDRGTGEWLEEMQLWRNLTILGDAVISANDASTTENETNTIEADGQDTVQMEGLTNTNKPIFYGGGNDDHDAGTIQYLSSRYGGRVVGTDVELNGMSIGGVGRGTDFSHVEIMNNVDDGIEIWGGTLNISNFSVWNIGDDSLDFDQGWRGRAQFGLIVQGYSEPGAGKGSGVADNALEHDGAEPAGAQPRSSVTAYNLTVIGDSAASGGALTQWRDNVRVQYRNSVFMNPPAEGLVHLDDTDGDGNTNVGFGQNGSHDWGTLWQTSVANDPAASHPTSGTGDFSHANLYQSQLPGNLIEMTNNVIWGMGPRPIFGYDSGEISSPFDPTTMIQNNNTFAGNMTADRPIQNIQRESSSSATTGIRRVVQLDPRAANDAADNPSNLLSGTDFFVETGYAGAFSPNHNWADGWTAADAYGFMGSVGPDQRAEAPQTTFEVKKSVVSFVAEPDKTYVVEESDNGNNWEVVNTISSQSGPQNVSPSSPDKLVRVRVQ
jgi:hypothetical protein